MNGRLVIPSTATVASCAAASLDATQSVIESYDPEKKNSRSAYKLANDIYLEQFSSHYSATPLHEPGRNERDLSCRKPVPS